MQQSFDQAFPHDPFCLGMCEWTACIRAKVNPHGQLHLPTATVANETHPQTRGQFEFSDDETLDKLSKVVTPANTGRSTKWALNRHVANMLA